MVLPQKICLNENLNKYVSTSLIFFLECGRRPCIQLQNWGYFWGSVSVLGITHVNLEHKYRGFLSGFSSPIVATRRRLKIDN